MPPSEKEPTTLAGGTDVGAGVGNDVGAGVGNDWHDVVLLGSAEYLPPGQIEHSVFWPAISLNFPAGHARPGTRHTRRPGQNTAVRN